MTNKICPTCNNKLSYGWYHSSKEYRYSCCTCNYQEVDGEEIDIYDSKIDTDAQEELKKVDAMSKMIGIVPPLKNCQCTREAEKEEYSAINRDIIKRNIALEVMLDASKNEISELKEKVASLREQLSTLQKVR